MWHFSSNLVSWSHSENCGLTCMPLPVVQLWFDCLAVKNGFKRTSTCGSQYVAICNQLSSTPFRFCRMLDVIVEFSRFSLDLSIYLYIYIYIHKYAYTQVDGHLSEWCREYSRLAFHFSCLTRTWCHPCCYHTNVEGPNIFHQFLWHLMRTKDILAEGSLEVKHLTIWTDELQRWEESEKTRSKKRKSEERRSRCEKGWKGRQVKSRRTAFFMWFVAPEGRKGG